jgi:hypothetical protein
VSIHVTAPLTGGIMAADVALIEPGLPYRLPMIATSVAAMDLVWTANRYRGSDATVGIDVPNSAPQRYERTVRRWR